MKSSPAYISVTLMSLTVKRRSTILCSGNKLQIFLFVAKDICITQFCEKYLLSPRKLRCLALFLNTYMYHTTEGLGIRCTNHLCDSCCLTDVNPHFIPSTLPGSEAPIWFQNVNSCRPIVMSSTHKPDKEWLFSRGFYGCFNSYHNVSELRRLWNTRLWCHVFQVSLYMQKESAEP